MNLLVLGKGKMGTTVIDLARQRGHHVEAHDEFDNPHGRMLTPERLQAIDVVADFTWPDAVMDNITACARARKNLLVGTTGWYEKVAEVRAAVEKSGIGFLYGGNFSIGVNAFYDIARSATLLLRQGYTPSIKEVHHIHKKDAPSGTAVKLRQVVEEAGGVKPEVESVREGEVVGFHELTFDAPGETIVISHSAKSRRAFADGAIRGAEWLKGKSGFYEFKDIYREV